VCWCVCVDVWVVLCLCVAVYLRVFSGMVCVYVCVCLCVCPCVCPCPSFDQSQYLRFRKQGCNLCEMCLFLSHFRLVGVIHTQSSSLPLASTSPSWLWKYYLECSLIACTRSAKCKRFVIYADYAKMTKSPNPRWLWAHIWPLLLWN